MLCEKCKKQFVGDTPLCSVCEKEQMLQEARQTIVDAVHDLIAYIKVAFIAEGCCLLVAILLWMLLPIVWFVFALIIVGCVVHIAYIYREMKLWFPYRDMLRNGRIEDLIDDVVDKPKGLYLLKRSGNCTPKDMRQRIGIMGDWFTNVYLNMKRASETIRHIGKADSDVEL